MLVTATRSARGTYERDRGAAVGGSSDREWVCSLRRRLGQKGARSPGARRRANRHAFGSNLAESAARNQGHHDPSRYTQRRKHRRHQLDRWKLDFRQWGKLLAMTVPRRFMARSLPLPLALGLCVPLSGTRAAATVAGADHRSHAGTDADHRRGRRFPIRPTVRPRRTSRRRSSKPGIPMTVSLNQAIDIAVAQSPAFASERAAYRAIAARYGAEKGALLPAFRRRHQRRARSEQHRSRRQRRSAIPATSPDGQQQLSAAT